MLGLLLLADLSISMQRCTSSKAQLSLISKMLSNKAFWLEQLRFLCFSNLMGGTRTTLLIDSIGTLSKGPAACSDLYLFSKYRNSLVVSCAHRDMKSFSIPGWQRLTSPSQMTLSSLGSTLSLKIGFFQNLLRFFLIFTFLRGITFGRAAF